MPNIVSVELITAKILLIRGRKVMVDRDLAQLYVVTTFNLNKAVKRNIERFPEDFMFQLTQEEFKNLIFQNGISSWGGTRKLPYVFTEQGVAMLSGVLHSKRAVKVNIQIMRAFVMLSRALLTNKELFFKLNDLERKVERHDMDIRDIFEAIRQLMRLPDEKRKIKGFAIK
ncbi:MAG: ORF6N domain-containing protein [Candidatus Omnitrophica bacterium]|jgi:hypothetical protein|nr:ORF6N domain-containing protein [Candidatus Omnitrophota bacterium]